MAARLRSPGAVACLRRAAGAEPEQPDRWSGEGAANASYTTGNTNEIDIGVDLKVKHKGGLWTQYGEPSGDYGDEDGVRNERDLTATADVERIFRSAGADICAGGGRTRSSRASETATLLGPGARYKVFDTQKLKMTLEGGLGTRSTTSTTRKPPARRSRSWAREPPGTSRTSSTPRSR